MDEDRTQVITRSEVARLIARREPAAPLAGRYRLLDLLDAGGSADVWRAHDDRTGHLVAIKLLRRNAPAALRDRSLEEARKLDEVRHPNIVTVLAAHPSAEPPFIVLELVHGERLDEVARRGPLPLARVVRIVTQLAGALDAMHVRGVLHLDVKPANVMLGERDRVTLIDFGTARPSGTSDDDVVGSPAYVAPEIVAGEAVGPASDIYGLGLIAYELLSGRQAFRSDRGAIAERTDPTAGERAVATLSEHLRAAVAGALARDPRHRHATATRFAQALADTLVPRAVRRRRIAASAYVARRMHHALALGLVLAVVGAAMSPGRAADLPARPLVPTDGVSLLQRPAQLRPAAFSLPPPDAYDAVLVTTSNDPVVAPGELWEWTAALRNVGWAGWHRGLIGSQAALGTADPLDNDRAARLGLDPGNWSHPTRPAVQATDWVGPGQIGWFVVQGRAPHQPGTYLLRLRPLIEGRAWLRDVGLSITLEVREPRSRE